MKAEHAHTSASSKEAVDEAIDKLIKGAANDDRLSHLLQQTSAKRATKAELEEYRRYLGEALNRIRRDQKTQDNIDHATPAEIAKASQAPTSTSSQGQETRLLEHGMSAAIVSSKAIEKAPSLSVTSTDSLLQSETSDVRMQVDSVQSMAGFDDDKVEEVDIYGNSSGVLREDEPMTRFFNPSKQLFPCSQCGKRIIRSKGVTTWCVSSSKE